MDRNQIIGFALIAVLFVCYLFYNQHEQQQYNEQVKADSISYAKTHPRPIKDSTKMTVATAPQPVNDSMKNALPPAYFGKADTITLENKKLSIRFCTKGAYPVAADIKDYVTSSGKPLYIFNGKGSMLSATLPYDNGKSTADLYFTPIVKDEPNGDKTIDFVADLKDGKKVEMIYSLPADNNMMRCDIALTNLNVTAPLSLQWISNLLPTEKDITNERMASQIYYRQKNDDQDYFTARTDEKNITTDGSPVKWLGLRKQFFSTALVCDEGFNKMDTKFGYKADDSGIVAHNTANFALALKPGTTQSVALRWYIGPNDYRTLDSYKIGMEDMVPLGYGIMAFVKYINKWALIPYFYFLSSFVKDYAIIIVLLTLSIRLILSFFTYKSYLSSAKMRVLKPELDELREKCGEDTQKFSMEQMKLYRSAGVNPLGGCLPMLIQIPVLLSMYYMFPSFMEFRQKHFLWCNDLSTYDSILDLHFTIPFYGDHVSLFCLLMTGTSLFLALYNKNMTPQDPNNPMMKYMPYIFPFMLIGMFNKMAAALTFYYTLSNMFSILQQFVLQKYFIDEKAIHAQLQSNKNKPAAPNKWAQKIEEIQKTQAEKSKPVQRINTTRK